MGASQTAANRGHNRRLPGFAEIHLVRRQFASPEARPDNRAMSRNEWQRRIARAEELGAQYSFAGEILRFYAAIVRFQQSFYGELGRSFSGRSVAGLSLEKSSAGTGASGPEAFTGPLPLELVGRFRAFLSVVETNGPDPLREAARELRDGGDDSPFQLLTVFWNGSETGALPPGPHDFFARAFLQPYAVSIRSRSNLRWSGPTPFLCPFCKRKPGLGVLRPLGDGGQRSLICSFCLAEWEFRRIVCPGCGEENHAKLPVYTAQELKHVRVEGCDSCRSYIKTVDLTKSGLGEPIVDEMAAIPLDLWAQKQGYTTLQTNLMQL
jgi:formate dehydrogenase maturation protein FdhE